MTPTDPESPESADAVLRAEAEKWVVRRDRGFSTREAADFERWLAADPRHAPALADATVAWSALDAIPSWIGRPIVAQANRRSIWRRSAFGGLAAAAAVALGIASGWLIDPSSRRPDGHPAIAAANARLTPQTRILPDGSRVHLNIGAEITEEFSAGERRVRLVRGEAYFFVTANPARPFVVRAGEIAVRAVGTAFNVRWQPTALDVLVTEGKVEVNASNRALPPLSPATEVPLVSAGHRAVVEIAAHANHPQVVVSEVSQTEIAQALAWHEPLRNLAGTTLAELAAEFERQTGQRMVVADPALKELQIGGRFRRDDLDELLRLLEENYGIASERGADGAIVLRKAR